MPVTNRTSLFFTVFMGGMTTLALEFTISRILQTVYGTSNLVWANVIGLVLLFLTLGYFIGGRLADKRPEPKLFYGLICSAAISGIFFILLTSALLRTAASAMASLNVGALAGSLVGVIFALAVPITLLGCISPFAIRLGVRDVAEAGRVSGQIYAVSTLGSLLGTYLPTLFILPLAGSRLTAVGFGLVLLLVGLGGLWQSDRKMAGGMALASLLLLPFIALWGFGQIKTAPGQLHERESAYNYIQVIERDGCNYLLLNEGQAYHSFYCPDDAVPNISVWNIMLAAPYFNPPTALPNPQNPAPKVAVIGLAAGTIPRQYLTIFPEAQIDGIEIDPEIIAVGYDYFALRDPRINAIAGDGRYAFNQLPGPYDLVTIDAYKVPYIPWHLTTAEFFTELHSKLSENGVVAVNVGRVPQDRRLVEAMTATMLEVFPTVHTVDVPGTLNTILFATVQPTTPDNLSLYGGEELPPMLREVLQTTAVNLRPTTPSDLIFTDERAPVETLIDSLVLNFLLGGGLEGLDRLEG
jgi:spermidine synthase